MAEFTEAKPKRKPLFPETEERQLLLQPEPEIQARPIENPLLPDYRNQVDSSVEKDRADTVNKTLSSPVVDQAAAVQALTNYEPSSSPGRALREKLQDTAPDKEVDQIFTRAVAQSYRATRVGMVAESAEKSLTQFFDTKISKEELGKLPDRWTPDKGMTVKEVANYLRMGPKNPDAPEMDLGDTVNVLKSLVNGFELDPDTLAKMEGRYGDGWRWQLASSVAFEAGVDIGTVVLGFLIPPVGSAMGIAKGAKAASILKSLLAVGVWESGVGATAKVATDIAGGNFDKTDAAIEYIAAAAAPVTLGAAAIALKPALKPVVKQARKVIDYSLKKTKDGNLAPANLDEGKVVLDQFESFLDPNQREPIIAAMRVSGSRELLNYIKEQNKTLAEAVDAEEMKMAFEFLERSTGIPKERIPEEFGIPRMLASVEEWKAVTDGITDVRLQKAVRVSEKFTERVEATENKLAKMLEQRDAMRERGAPWSEERALNQQITEVRNKIKDYDKVLQMAAKTLAYTDYATTSGNRLADQMISGKMGFDTVARVLAGKEARDFWYEFTDTGMRMQARQGEQLSAFGRLTDPIKRFKWFNTRELETANEPFTKGEIDLLASGAKNLWDSVNLRNRHSDFMAKRYLKAFSQIPEESREKLNRVLEKGGKLGKEFSEDELRLPDNGSLTDEEIDAYKFIRADLNRAHMVMDRMLTREADRAGIVEYNGTLYHVDPVLTKAPIEGPAPGYVRMYHGAAGKEKITESRWFTTDQKYAAGKGDTVHYVDVPRNNPIFDSQYPEQTVEKGFTVQAELPENISTRAKIYSGGKKKLIPVNRQTGGKLSVVEVDPSVALNKPSSILEYIPGYVPRQYKDVSWHITEIDVSTGQTRRIRGLTNYGAANAEKQRLIDEAGEGSGKRYVIGEWDKGTQVHRILWNNEDTDVIQGLSPELKEKLKDSLLDMGAESVALYRKMVDVDFTLARNMVGPRARVEVKGVKGAELEKVPALESIADYYQTLAAREGTSDWRTWYVGNFKDKYKDIANTDVHWSDPNYIPKPKDRLDQSMELVDYLPIYERAIREQKFAKHSLFRIATGWEEGAGEWIDTQMAKWAASNNPVLKRAGEAALGHKLERGGIDSVINPAFEKIFFGLRHLGESSRRLTTWSRLLTFSIPQLVIQGSQTVITGSMHPIHAAVGMSKLLRAVAVDSAVRIGGGDIKFMEKESVQILQEIRRLGFNIDTYSNDMRTFQNIQRGGDIYHRSNWKTAAGKLNEWMAKPYTMGEGFNRSFAYVTTREWAVAEMKKGAKSRFLGVDGKVFKGEVGSDEFIRAVGDRAKKLSLNMGEPGQLEAFRGLKGAIFQFWQVYPKFLNIFETKAFTPAEKIAALTGFTGVFGFGALPLFYDLIDGVPALMYKTGQLPLVPETVDAADIDNYKEWQKLQTEWMGNFLADVTPSEAMGLEPDFYQTWLKGGFIKAATKELSQDNIFHNLDIASRVAFGRWFNDVADNMEWDQFIPAVSVYQDYITAFKTALNPAEYMALVEAYTGEMDGKYDKGTYIERIEALSGDKMPTKYAETVKLRFLEQAEKVSRPFPSFNKPLRALLHGELGTTNYRNPETAREIPIGKAYGTSDAQVHQLWFGFTPGGFADLYERTHDKYTSDQMKADFIEKSAKRLIDAGTDTRKKDLIIREVARDAKEIEEARASTTLGYNIKNRGWEARDMINTILKRAYPLWNANTSPVVPLEK